MHKRAFLKTLGLLTGAAIFSGFKKNDDESNLTFTNNDQLLVDNKFELPNLPYAYDALEPYIDKQTMEIHHGKHHKAYVDNLNKAIGTGSDSWNSLEEICQKINKKTEPLLRNNAGGHWNHSFFWESLTNNKGQTPGTKTIEAINLAFGSFDKFKEQFTQAATGRFGSGWAWLCKNKNGELFISSTPNQDNPLMKKVVDKVGIPILGLDVWEHAYYLKYQNKRAEYIKSFFEIINWEKVEQRFIA